MMEMRIVWQFAPVLMIVACVGGAGCVGSFEVRGRPSGLECCCVTAKRNPYGATNHNNVGISCAATGQLHKAHSALCRAVTLQPRNALYRNNLAAVLIDRGRYDSAYRQLLAAHGRANGNHNFQYMLSLEFSEEGNETSLLTRLMGERPTAGIPSASPSRVENGPALAPPKPIQRPSKEPSRIPRNVVPDANSDVQPQREERDSSGPSSGVELLNVVPQAERTRKSLEIRPPRDVVPIQTSKTTLRFVNLESANEEN